MNNFLNIICTSNVKGIWLVVHADISSNTNNPFTAVILNCNIYSLKQEHGYALYSRVFLQNIIA